MEVAVAVSWSAVVGLAKTDFFTFVCIMKNGRQIRTQLAEKRLKLDSSSLHYEVAPTGPRPVQCRVCQ